MPTTRLGREPTVLGPRVLVLTTFIVTRQLLLCQLAEEATPRAPVAGAVNVGSTQEDEALRVALPGARPGAARKDSRVDDGAELTGQRASVIAITVSLASRTRSGTGPSRMPSWPDVNVAGDPSARYRADTARSRRGSHRASLAGQSRM